MYVWNKLILKAYLACCNEGTKRSLENILILQNKTEAKTSHLTSQHKLSWNKRYCLRHVPQVSCPAVGGYKSPAWTAVGRDLGRGMIFTHFLYRNLFLHNCANRSQDTVAQCSERNVYIKNKIFLFCQNTTIIAYNHQHPSMATCFVIFWIIFRPIFSSRI